MKVHDYLVHVHCFSYHHMIYLCNNYLLMIEQQQTTNCNRYPHLVITLTNANQIHVIITTPYNLDSIDILLNVFIMELYQKSTIATNHHHHKTRHHHHLRQPRPNQSITDDIITMILSSWHYHRCCFLGLTPLASLLSTKCLGIPHTSISIASTSAAK